MTPRAILAGAPGEFLPKIWDELFLATYFVATVLA
jgi:hypothetical protein